MTKIYTHSGKFHLDECLACSMLKYLPEFEDHEIVRTDDVQDPQEGDVQVDIGGEYDHSRLCYDHHQKGFEETYDEKSEIKLSSAGLIYRHYGASVLRLILINGNCKVNERYLQIITKKIYFSFIRGIDGQDNMIPKYTPSVVPNYCSVNCLCARIDRLNPSWLETEVDPDSRFEEAMQLAFSEFSGQVLSLWKNWILALDLVHRNVEESLKKNRKSEILLLSQPCPFIQHLFDEEWKREICGQFKYVVFESSYRSEWIIRAVPIQKLQKSNRVPFPEAWRGLRLEDLQKVTSIKESLFVHKTGFMATAANQRSAIKMAKKSLLIFKQSEDNENSQEIQKY
ncbi:protein myg1 [Anaeramoeba flamelloides]|uniref:Protein myg1 n=1 Tax=Anaeramoeba flamelloides TaxID=1746091 RepID=A0ABQ8YBW6_9EUKA|nr:protein myg1 [Anaeramoeba flamelloides]